MPREKSIVVNVTFKKKHLKSITDLYTLKKRKKRIYQNMQKEVSNKD